MMAVIGVPVAKTNLLKCLNTASIPGPDGKHWKRTEIHAFFDLEPVQSLCRITMEWGSAEYYSLFPTVAGSLWDEAVRLGEFEPFDNAANSVLRLNDNAIMERYFPTQAAGVRALRRAFSKQDETSFTIMLAKISLSCWRWDKGNMEGTVIEALCNPFHTQKFNALPPEMAAILFPIMLLLALPDAADYRLIAETLFAYPPSGCDDLELLRVDRLILHGRLDEAKSRLAAIEDPQSFSYRALLALSQHGDEDEALALYREGLKKMGRGGFYQSWTGAFYPILLYKTGADERKLKSCLKSLDSWGDPEDFSVLEPLFQNLLKIKENDKTKFPQNVTLGRDILRSFLALLLLRWLGSRVKALKRDAETLAAQLDERGLTFLSSELRNAWELEGPAVLHPLIGILKQEEEWERSLSALSNISGDTASETSRIAWRVEWLTSGTGDILALQVTPVEQALQKTGWSKGRNLSLRRLYKNGGNIPNMTEQDLRAASAVRVTRSYYGTDYSLDAQKALTFLEGHPFVFNSAGEKLDIAVSPPILSVRENKQGYVVELLPFPQENETYFTALDGANRLRVTHFEPRHLRVAHILGAAGLTIPKKAKEPLMRTLETLASTLTVQSNLEGLGGAVEEIRADARIFVQLQPDGTGLAAEARVRPLGTHGVSCFPGQGGTTFLGMVDGKRVRALRDLRAESDALFALQAACPALSDAEAVGEGWRIAEPGLALELLSQLQEMGDAVVVEWPRGQSMRLAYTPMGERNFSASIRQARDWFAISGELKVSENLVLDMKTLLENLKGEYGRFIPLGNGEFLALTREFQRRLKALASLGDERDGEVRLSPMAAGVADELLEGAGKVDAAAEWKSRLSLIKEAERLNPVLPSAFKGELRDYQLEGFRWLTRLAHWGAGACLADDMGLGKTIQALAVLLARGTRGPSLVVAPTSVCPNWAAEAARFTPTLRARELRGADRKEVLSSLGPMDLVIVSYGILQNERERLAEIEWNVIVLDEAQAIKNMGTKRSSAVMRLKGYFRAATTGTPIENHLGELWNLFRFLNPGYLGSFESFWRRFGAPIERDGDGDGERDGERDGDAKGRLRRMIRPFILRRTKEQVLSELPGKTEITLRVDMKDEERAFYEALRREAVESLSGVGDGDAGEGRFQVLAALTRLRRACCNAGLVNVNGSGSGNNLPSAKLEAFEDVLTETRGGGHKALVFSQFVDHLAILRAWLDKERIPYQYLDGSTPPDERKKRVAAFQAGEGDCFLISLRAGGTGLNLTAADCVIHMDPWWNPAVEAQASDRAHRIGQERPVTVYRIVARGTIEEKIVALHERKRDLADGLLADSDTAVRLSVEDLLELIRE